MDEITWLWFEDKLSPTINGHLRNPIIRQYQLFKGKLYIPDVVLNRLKWTKSDPLNILKVQTDMQWQLIEKFKDKAIKYTPASGTIAIDNNKSIKCKADEISSVIIISNTSKTNLGLQNQDEATVKISSVIINSNKRPKINLDLQNQDAPIELI